MCKCVQPCSVPSALTLLALRAQGAGLAQAGAADGVAAPVARAAVAGAAAVGSPASAVTGCNRPRHTAPAARATGPAASQQGRASHPPPAPWVLGGGFSRGRGTGHGHLPLWQLRPVHPGAQLQRPVAGSQCPSLAQEQRVWQPGPNQPAGHTAGAGRVSGGRDRSSRAGAQVSCLALTVLAAAARVAGAAPAGSGLRLTGSSVLTHRADLLAAEPPAALGAI